MIKKLCHSPGCSAFAISGSCYCEKHKKESDERRIPFENANRANNTMYNTTAWRKLRKEAISLHPYCSLCGCESSKENPLEADHIIPPRGNETLFFDIHNLQILCRTCHRYKTAQEINERRQYKNI